MARHANFRSKLRGWLRRQREANFPDSATKAYRRWIADRLQSRLARPHPPVEQGLLSVITAVWDGSPAEFLEQLAISITAQNKHGACEWVIVDNGCRRPELLQLLKRLQQQSWIKVAGEGKNLGIARGLRLCLEMATGRYVLPVDADDVLYPDALGVVAAHIRKGNFPPLLYSDEDKLIGLRSSQPYFKPDFDPVLLSNSAYTAHLGVIDREKALTLGAYTDSSVEGSVDWDLFLRFVSAGFRPIHIPEILYQWRIHAESTADDGAVKDYVGSSQREALRGFLDRHPCGSNFTVVQSPLLAGPHFRLNRATKIDAGSFVLQRWQQIPGFPALDGLRSFVDSLAANVIFICLIDESLNADDGNWPTEAAGIFELFPDTIVVGGRLRNPAGCIVDADQHFGFDGACSSPNVGRIATDPGYFAQMFKQRSVSAVSSQIIAVDIAFLARCLRDLPSVASPYFLGAWFGAVARSQNRRVVYSPYVSAMTDTPWSSGVTSEERTAFANTYSEIIPDRRYYPVPFSLSKPYSIG